MTRAAVLLTLAVAATVPARRPIAQPSKAPRIGTAERVMKLRRDSPWKAVTAVPIAFPTHHPQGMVKIGDTFYVSSVEVKVPTRRLLNAEGEYDRDAGQGVAHLFRFDVSGRLIADLTIGESTIYHPGGLDYDGRFIWVPVAEYRPNSRAIVYRVNPETMQATEAFRFPDHIGAIVHDTDSGALHGISWGSRRFYRWRVGSDGTIKDLHVKPEALRTLNTSHYLDYQDCKYAGQHRMLCTGVTELRQKPDSTTFRLGGIDLVSLRDGRPLHQVPLLLWTESGVDMTHNPVWLEATATGLRGYFMPEDDRSTLYVYEVETD